MLKCVLKSHNLFLPKIKWQAIIYKCHVRIRVQRCFHLQQHFSWKRVKPTSEVIIFTYRSPVSGFCPVDCGWNRGYDIYLKRLREHEGQSSSTDGDIKRERKKEACRLQDACQWRTDSVNVESNASRKVLKTGFIIDCQQKAWAMWLTDKSLVFLLHTLKGLF